MKDLSFNIADGLPDAVREQAITTCERYGVDWYDCYGIEGAGDPIVFLMYKRNEDGFAYYDENTGDAATYRIPIRRLLSDG